LANMCQAVKARMIHISTDCVFAGTSGMYLESDVSDAIDLYGRTKYLGEVNYPPALTIRTSIIGRELQTTSGLIEWFLSNRDSTVKGFQKAIYTGFTTIALADVIANIIDNHPELAGLYQVSSEPINKHDLLTLIKEKFGLSCVIEPETETCIDRSLDSSRFRQFTGFVPPSWDSMINQMAEDPTPYDNWRSDT
jgi:dTDP-4-dehydrorhamnose reductase